MGESMPDFVDWREQPINQERGSRLVHYYLDNSSGESHLAVVGTERSLRHMLYVVAEEFSEAYGLGVSLKWRSRREVIDWLISFLPTRKNSANCLRPSMAFNGINGTGSYPHNQMEQGRSLCDQDIVWCGISWTCGKQLKHYQAFTRNGTSISTHSFVLVMSEEEILYLAYLEDMYEDKKGQKKVKVRWFHQNQEFACTIPPPIPHPCEVFITPYCQVISAECVDGIATVLTPDHYEKCIAMLPSSSSVGIRMCFRQYSKNKFKLFDLRTLRGYFNQGILSCLDLCSVSGDDEEYGQGGTIKHGGSKRIRFVKGGHNRFLTHHSGVKKSGHMKTFKQAYQKLKNDSAIRRPVSVKFIGPRNSSTPPFNVDEKIEMLCQDSGIRGCWFKCTVLQFSQNRLKVRYEDLQDEDGCGNLEEWVPAFRQAAPDKLGLRCSGRLSLRPCPSSNSLSEDAALDIGTSVDAWWSDGWWEGVISGVDCCKDDDSVQVYFPGEDIFLICQRNNLRISKDWVEDQWVDIKAKPDVLSTVSSHTPQSKLTSLLLLAKGVESGSSSMSERGGITPQANSNDADMHMKANLNIGSGDGELEYTKHCVDTEPKPDISSVIASGSARLEEIISNKGKQMEDNGSAENTEELNPMKQKQNEGSQENIDGGGS